MLATLQGYDKADLDQQIWKWREGHPDMRITKCHAIQTAPLEMVAVGRVRKVLTGPRLSVSFEYETA